MIEKTFGVNFNSVGGALTLEVSQVSNIGHIPNLIQSKTHKKSGWTISAQTYEDYYAWVNEFEAIHPKYGKVWGDFEEKVYATSEEGFANFYENHPPQAWDYGDI